MLRTGREMADNFIDLVEYLQSLQKALTSNNFAKGKCEKIGIHLESCDSGTFLHTEAWFIVEVDGVLDLIETESLINVTHLEVYSDKHLVNQVILDSIHHLETQLVEKCKVH